MGGRRIGRHEGAAVGGGGRIVVGPPLPGYQTAPPVAVYGVPRTGPESWRRPTRGLTSVAQSDTADRPPVAVGDDALRTARVMAYAPAQLPLWRPAPRRAHYFAYGSNIDQRRMLARAGAFYTRDLALLDGWRLVFNKAASDGRRGYANIERARGGRVEGVLYEVDEGAIQRLSLAEGVATKHYLEEELAVRRAHDGALVPAVVYLAHPLRVCAGLRPSRGYLAHLLASDDLLSAGYMAWLASIETLPDRAPDAPLRWPWDAAYDDLPALDGDEDAVSFVWGDEGHGASDEGARRDDARP